MYYRNTYIPTSIDTIYREAFYKSFTKKDIKMPIIPNPEKMSDETLNARIEDLKLEDLAYLREQHGE